MTVRRSLASLAAMLGLTFTLTGGVLADPLPEAQAAFDRGAAAHRAGDVDAALAEWAAAAEGGHTGAAWVLGNLYDKGVGGVTRHPGKAYEYYLQAARRTAGSGGAAWSDLSRRQRGYRPPSATM